MKLGKIVTLVTLLLCGGISADAQTVTLEFHNGRVNLSAHEASVRVILSEWTRLGGTRITNGDRVPDESVTLELTDVPEREALDIVLRRASGYIAAWRSTADTGASAFDRILILPTSSAPPAASAAASGSDGPRPNVPADVELQRERDPVRAILGDRELPFELSPPRANDRPADGHVP